MMEIHSFSDLTSGILSLIPYLVIYLAIAMGFLIVNSVVAGFNGATLTMQDFGDSLIWPISVSVLIGLLIRVILEIIKDRTKSPSKSPVKSTDKE